MSADKSDDNKTPTAPEGSRYRTLTPTGAPVAAPTPVAAPKAPPAAAPDGKKAEPHPEPTRFGDWEVKGRCIDF